MIKNIRYYHPTIRPLLFQQDLMDATAAFGLSVNIAHADCTRRRLLLALIDGSLATCDVAIEGRESGEVPEVVESLLANRLQVAGDATFSD